MIEQLHKEINIASNVSHVAKIIAVISQKGGVGKSMIDTQFAIALALMSYRVAVIDIDQTQYSAAKILTRRKEQGLPEIPFYISTPGDLKTLLSRIKNDFDLIFVESGGKMGEELKVALPFADLVIMPIQPLLADIDTIPQVEEVITEFIAQGVRLDLVKCLIIPNRVMMQQGVINLGNDDNRLVQLLKIQQHLKYFKITKNYFKDRQNIYNECYRLGKHVSELKGIEINSKDPVEGERSIQKALEESNNILNEVFYD